MDTNNLCLNCMEEKASKQDYPHCGHCGETGPVSPHHLPPGTMLHGKYLIGRVLGQGGFGITYLGWDTALDIKLAIKEYFPHGLVARKPGQSGVDTYSGDMKNQYTHGLESFLKEAKTLARFSEHPNIINVRDFFQANSTAYMAMNYIKGMTLKEYLDEKGGQISFTQALKILMPVLDALKEVHQEGIMHRDISPDNIFIDIKGRVILIDFGAARHEVQQQSRSLSVVMKAGYSPMEQYQSKGKQGPWTDIYAAAATFYRCITGQVPPESFDRVDEDMLEPPSALDVKIEDRQEQTLLKALAVRPKDRYQTVEEFQNELFSAEPEEVKLPLEEKTTPVKTVSDPPTVKEKPFINKNKKIGLVAAVAVAAITIILGSLNLTWGEPEEAEKNGLDEEAEQVAEISHTTADQKESTEQEEKVAETEEEPVNEYGNTPGNIVNGGRVAQQGDWIYYRNLDDGSKIYRMRTDGSGQEPLNDDSSSYINIVGDWIYYRNLDDDGIVYRMQTDGSGRERLNDNSSSYINVVGDWIYYSNLDDGRKLYRMRTDGSGQEPLNDDSSHCINVSGNWIYCIFSNWGLIQRMRTDGSNLEYINLESTSYVSASYINVVGDWIYYSNLDDGRKLYRIRTDDSNQERLNNDDSWNINVTGDWIYYSNLDDAGKLYRMRTDGSSQERLNNDRSSSINVAGDWIYYSNLNDGRKLYRMRTDGSNRERFY